jgi:hypothetical protein
VRPFIRAIAMSTVSGIALANVVTPFHDLTLQTILLRAGLRLGFIKAFPG